MAVVDLAVLAIGGLRRADDGQSKTKSQQSKDREYEIPHFRLLPRNIQPSHRLPGADGCQAPERTGARRSGE